MDSDDSLLLPASLSPSVKPNLMSILEFKGSVSSHTHTPVCFKNPEGHLLSMTQGHLGPEKIRNKKEAHSPIAVLKFRMLKWEVYKAKSPRSNRNAGHQIT